MPTSDASACLIVKDAQASLPRCLESIAGLVKEMIVVDTGSSDATQSMAESLGCRVYRYPWADDFSAARNESIRHAAGRWILWLDADEYLDEPNHQKLRSFVATLPQEDAAYAMTQRSPLPDGSPLDLQHVRLFRNHPAIRWQYRVHEQIAPAINLQGHPIRPVDIVINHSGYDDPHVHRRKLQRNARLLELDLQDRPNDAFVLFNLGTAYEELGRTAQAIPLLRQSLHLSPPEYSTVRDTYAALLQCHRRLGAGNDAWAVCLEGRRRFPDDVALLFWQSQLLRDQGDLAAAENCLTELVRMQPGRYFGAADAGIRKYVAPHTLGLIYWQQGRVQDAEKQWQALVAAHPDYKDSWLMLAEVYLLQKRWTDLEAIIARCEANAWAFDAAILRSRLHLATKDFVSARTILEQLIAQAPDAMPPRFYLTHVLLGEAKDWDAAERALRDLLNIDPNQPQAWYNLTALLRRQNRLPEARAACTTGLTHCPADPNLTRLDQAMRAGN
jgi:tetratricopeptide (TPR) repeat protein